MRLRRGAVLWMLAVLAVGVLAGWGLAAVLTLRSDITTLRAQLFDLGETPKVGPAGNRGDRGDTGDRGERGERGRPGRDGRDGVDGITPACWFLPSQCVGPAGRDGKDGLNGTNGVDGTDGKDGTNGVDGKDGQPGPSCPAGYSLQPSTIRGDDVLVCTRDAA